MPFWENVVQKSHAVGACFLLSRYEQCCIRRALRDRTTRGFISGAVGKQLSLTVESAKREDGEHCYRVIA
ncbi:MAG: hypothetical protein AAB225_27670 [Acidobacteriota bacterium]